VLGKDKEIMAFPLLSGIVTLILVISFFVPLAVLGILGGGVLFYLALAVFYVLSYFIVIFFNTGLVACAYKRLTGGDPTFNYGINAALAHLGPIIAWAVISATVGIVLRMISERSGLIGKIITGLVGAAWSLVTFFVIPVIVVENKGVIESMRGSVALFRRTWGESIVGQVGIGLPFVILAFVGIIPMAAAFMTGSRGVIIAALVVFVIWIALLSIVAAALQGIFVAALYQYATTGTVPRAFDQELIKGAFRQEIKDGIV
jgi:hypothetical protein